MLAAALPLRASATQLTLLTLAIVGAGAVVAFLRWPPLGLIALLLTALMMPSPSLPGGLNVSVLLLIMLLGSGSSTWWYCDASCAS